MTSTHGRTLWQLADSVFDPLELNRLRTVVNDFPGNQQAVNDFDCSLPGPNMSILTIEGSGQYAIEDRDVFRPLQYCSQFLFLETIALEWMSRETVHMAGLHLEGLIKRVGRVGRLPLGAALGRPIVRSKLPDAAWQSLKAFASIYNTAKHDVDQPKDTHLFTPKDAVLAYFLSRRLALPLYPMAGLGTAYGDIEGSGPSIRTGMKLGG